MGVISLYRAFYYTFVLLVYHQCMYMSHSMWINKVTFYGIHLLGHDAVQFGTYTTICWRKVFILSSWYNSKMKGVIFPTAPIQKEGPGTVPNIKYLDDFSRFMYRISTYLHMRWSTQNVQNAICNIFRVQTGVIFQELLWWHFSLHQSRTDTLQQ